MYNDKPLDLGPIEAGLWKASEDYKRGGWKYLFADHDHNVGVHGNSWEVEFYPTEEDEVLMLNAPTYIENLLKENRRLKREVNEYATNLEREVIGTVVGFVLPYPEVEDN